MAKDFFGTIFGKDIINDEFFDTVDNILKNTCSTFHTIREEYQNGELVSKDEEKYENGKKTLNIHQSAIDGEKPHCCNKVCCDKDICKCKDSESPSADILTDKTTTSELDESVKARITGLSELEGDIYVANSNVDFINNATSLNDADKKLSEAIKNVSEDLSLEYSKAVIAQANKIKDLYESLSKRYSELLAKNEELKEQLNTAKEKLTEISKICASSK